jgi:predicted RNA binding protein YcfA (HicA-like mRNA interferase family)
MRVMERLGFDRVRRSGDHLILQHSKTGLVVTLPEARAEVPAVVAQAIMTQVDNYDITSRDEFL